MVYKSIIKLCKMDLSEETMNKEYRQLLIYLYTKTVKEMAEFYYYSDDWIDTMSDTLSLNTHLLLTKEEMKAWLTKEVEWEYTKTEEKNLPGYYGELDDYEGELVDIKNKRLLYIGGNRNRGLYINFNIFISAPAHRNRELALLMNRIFLFEKESTNKFIVKEAIKLPFINLDISVHPFKIGEKTSSVGLLFSYYFENKKSTLDKIMTNLPKEY